MGRISGVVFMIVVVFAVRFGLPCGVQFFDGGADFLFEGDGFHFAGIERRQLRLGFAESFQQVPAAFEVVPVNVRRAFPPGPPVGVQGADPGLLDVAQAKPCLGGSDTLCALGKLGTGLVGAIQADERPSAKIMMVGPCRSQAINDLQRLVDSVQRRPRLIAGEQPFTSQYQKPVLRNDSGASPQYRTPPAGRGP
jgi:hypothetical protein